MTLELFVAAMCLQGTGCSAASQAYYRGNEHLQDRVELLKERVEEFEYTKALAPIVIPAVSYLANQRLLIKLDSNWSIEASRDNQIIQVKWAY